MTFGAVTGLSEAELRRTLEEAQRRKHRLVAEQLRIPAGGRILDLGCGWGGMLAFFRSQGVRGTGVTLSRNQARACRRHGLDVHLTDARTVTRESYGEFDSECPGYCGAQDTFYVGTLKGVGRIYQQTFIDTYSKVAFAKLYTEKTPITAADLLNDRVLPFFAEHDIPLSRVLTDRGSEYCGTPDRHPYELYLALEDVEHTRTRTKRPQTNGICERFHKTVLNEFYRVTFRKRFYDQLEPLQTALDEYLDAYNRERPHQGRWCYGKTPMQTFQDTKALAKEKRIA